MPLAQPPLHATSPRQLRYLLPLAQFDVGRAQAYRRGGARAKRSTGSDLTEEQKQEIREAFGLLGSGVGGGGGLAASAQRPSERLFAGCPLDLAAEPSPRFTIVSYFALFFVPHRSSRLSPSLSSWGRSQRLQGCSALVAAASGPL